MVWIVSGRMLWPTKRRNFGRVRVSVRAVFMERHAAWCSKKVLLSQAQDLLIAFADAGGVDAATAEGSFVMSGRSRILKR